MASLTDHKGLDVLDGGSPAPGGGAISENFKTLVDWHPRSEWTKTVPPDPEVDNTSTDFYPGSFWLYIDAVADPAEAHLMICIQSSAEDAVWKEIKMWTLT